MCKNYYECIGCPIYDSYASYDPREDVFCECWIPKHPAEAVTLVEKWSKEHPEKTILEDFLEKYPKAKMCNDGKEPRLCLKSLYGLDSCPVDNCLECWNQPISEVE